MRICFIGDSFINGTGDDEALGWVGRIVARARKQGRDITSYNLGIRRDTSADIAARWMAEVEPRLPPPFERRLAFAFGANDCVADGDRPRVVYAQAVANTETILRTAAFFAPTLVIGPAPVLADAATDRRVQALSKGQQTLCRRMGVPFLPIFDFIAACEPWRDEAKRGDGTHPNKNGYAALADFIWRWPALQTWLKGNE